MNAITKAQLSSAALLTLRNSIARECNGGEFNLFVEYCQRVSLDPLRKQVVPIIFNKSDPDKRQMVVCVTIDGLRVLAKRQADYRPDENEPVITYDEAAVNEKSNPLGIVKCTVTLWQMDRGNQWHPVNGTAYWEEYAPLYNGALDKRTLWPTKPRVMIAKVAESIALRKGWPAEFGGVYEPAELDMGKVIEGEASEKLDQYIENLNLERVGANYKITIAAGPNADLEHVPLDRFADRILELAGKCENLDEIATLRSRNKPALQEFWAKNSGDAHALKTELEEIEDRLRDRETEPAE